MFCLLVGPAVKPTGLRRVNTGRYLASDEVKSASAVTDDQASDTKTVQAMARSVQVGQVGFQQVDRCEDGLDRGASTSELKKLPEL